MTFTDIKKIIIIGLLTALMTHVINLNENAFAVEYAVPNNGSPYEAISSLKEGEILHIPTGIKVTKDQMFDDISSSRVIYVGEVHDNFESHTVQLEILKEMVKRFPDRIAVGMEMLRRPSQPQIEKWQKGELSQKDFLHIWYLNWGEGYENYSKILEFIKKNNIPLIALKSSKDIEHMLRKKGINGMSEEEKAVLPEMDYNDPYHKLFADSIFGSHGKNSHVTINKPYNTLLLWEETMAERLAEFLKETAQNGKKIIVFAGSFHVEYSFGIPKRTFRRVPHSYSIVLPKVTKIPEELKATKVMDVRPVQIPLYLGDYAWNVNYRVLDNKNDILLGVSIKTDDKGLQVVRVQDNSNASKAGILAGDIIVSMDDKTLASLYELKALLKTKKIGDESSFLIIRDKAKVNIDVVFNK